MSSRPFYRAYGNCKYELQIYVSLWIYDHGTYTDMYEAVMCESGHLESGSESRHLESESRRIWIHLYFLESESESSLNPNPAKKSLESGFAHHWYEGTELMLGQGFEINLYKLPSGFHWRICNEGFITQASVKKWRWPFRMKWFKQ